MQTSNQLGEAQRRVVRERVWLIEGECVVHGGEDVGAYAHTHTHTLNTHQSVFLIAGMMLEKRFKQRAHTGHIMHTMSLCIYTREQQIPIRHEENTFYTWHPLHTISLSITAHHCDFAKQLDTDEQNTFYI